MSITNTEVACIEGLLLAFIVFAVGIFNGKPVRTTEVATQTDLAGEWGKDGRVEARSAKPPVGSKPTDKC